MIEIRDLVRRFDDESGIAYNDMAFEDGKSYVMLGASGCGKSTLLNMIAGVLSPYSGSIFVDGHDMAKENRRKKDAYRVAHIGYIFQDFKLIEEMTVADNIELLRLENVDVSGIDDILSKFGILNKKNQKVAKLSGGEKQRVAIARALVKKPDIILADEPTGNLNYAIGRVIIEELLSVSKGKTLICVTHDDRLAELFDARIDMNAIAKGVEKHA